MSCIHARNRTTFLLFSQHQPSFFEKNLFADYQNHECIESECIFAIYFQYCWIMPLLTCPRTVPPHHSFLELLIRSFNSSKQAVLNYILQTQQSSTGWLKQLWESFCFEENVSGEDNFAAKWSFPSFVLTQYLLSPPSQFPCVYKQAAFSTTYISICLGFLHFQFHKPIFK